MGAPALVTAQEIAELLELPGRAAVLDLRRHRLGFPQPVGRRRRSLVWLRSDVEAWAAGPEPVDAGSLNDPVHQAVTEPSSRRDTAETFRS